LRVNQYFLGHLARILAGLDAVQEGERTLLDNTMIVWVGEMGDGAHGFERWPAVIVGGNGFSNFRYGRYLYHPSHTEIEAWSYNGTLDRIALPHQHFLVSLAQQFGLDIDSVGETSLQAGSVNCTGPLEGLV